MLQGWFLRDWGDNRPRQLCRCQACKAQDHKDWGLSTLNFPSHLIQIYPPPPPSHIKRIAPAVRSDPIYPMPQHSNSLWLRWKSTWNHKIVASALAKSENAQSYKYSSGITFVLFKQNWKLNQGHDQSPLRLKFCC